MSSLKKVFGLLLLLGVCLLIPTKTEASALDMTVDIARIGDADAMLLGINGSYMVVDTGTSSHTASVQKLLTNRSIQTSKKITAVTITHFDGDHVGGFPALLTYAKSNNINIYRVYARNYDRTQLEYLKTNRSSSYVHYIKFLNAISTFRGFSGSVTYVNPVATANVDTVYNFSKDLKDNSKNVNGNKFWYSPHRDSGSNFLLGETAQVEWLNRSASYLQTEGDAPKEVNNDSLIFKITSGTKSMIFLGDIAWKATDDLIKSGKSLKVTAVKIAHHGWAGSTYKSFMDKALPTFSVTTTDVPSRLADMAGKNVGNLYYTGNVSGSITTVTFNTTQRITNYYKYEL